MSIEKQVADTILQEKTEIIIKGNTYYVAPPTIGTLIKVSGLISQIPEIDTQTDNIIYESLNKAKYCEVMGEILATLIVGSKYKPIFKRFNKKDKLAKIILDDLSPSDYSDKLAMILARMDVGSFFGSISFLNGVNLLKPTKKTPQTQSGQQSQV